MNKADRLCAYIDLLVSEIYCMRVIETEESMIFYHKLIDGLKKVGFTCDFSNLTKFKDIEV